MFGFGSGELMMIALVVLIVVGPTKMPTFMKSVAKGLKEFRSASSELRKQAGIDELMRDIDPRAAAAAPRRLPSQERRAPRALSVAELERERPPDGVDIVRARAEALRLLYARDAARDHAEDEEFDEFDDADAGPIAREDVEVISSRRRREEPIEAEIIGEGDGEAGDTPEVSSEPEVAKA